MILKQKSWNLSLLVSVQVKNRRDGESFAILATPALTVTTQLTLTATGFVISDGLRFLSLNVSLGTCIQPKIEPAAVTAISTRNKVQ
jgi:hypothetical protein